MIRKTLLVAALAFAGSLSVAPAPAEAQQTVVCQSRSNDRDERTYCRIDTRDGVRLSRQLSRAECERGRSWGVDRRGLWVSRGCRAQFVTGVRRDDRRDDRYDRDGRYDDRSGNATSSQVERLCYDAVRNKYDNVRAGDVRIQNAGVDRDGNYAVRWATRDRSGTCRINQYGRVFDFRTDNR